MGCVGALPGPGTTSVRLSFHVHWIYGPDFEPTGDVFFSPVKGTDAFYENQKMTRLI